MTQATTHGSNKPTPMHPDALARMKMLNKLHQNKQNPSPLTTANKPTSS